MTVLEPVLRRQIARHHGLPILSGGLELSVEGLHFVGASAVGSFGPLLRFIAGAGFAARRVTRTAVDSTRTAGAFADDGLEGYEQARLWVAAEREHS